ncbi:XRE family transcriptional regulator [Streptomyces sp. NBC_01618]|uniref:MmyB family transcriptional regulator n=1 Tax=Streptomyces sp. NBC_01618 TaxID=2975900 RepID=UPI00386D1D29|nr:XRE family transcriptional regulator [Streptomyces sp. NBC_01618]
MVTGILSEVGKHVSSRWVTTVLLPGLLLVAVTAAGCHLGHTHALDADELADWVDHLAREAHRRPARAAVAAGVGLRSVARALRLDPDETAHVMSFVEHAAPSEQSPGWVSRNLLSLVESLGPNPAVVLDPHWDLLAWNSGYTALLTDLARLAPRQRNLLWLVFRWPPARTLLASWEPEARSLLDQFRAKVARHPEDGRYAEITEELLADPDAARWYGRRETSAFHPSVRHFRHPVAGDLQLRYVKLAAVDEPGHHLLAYLPDDRATEEALRVLVG